MKLREQVKQDMTEQELNDRQTDSKISTKKDWEKE